MENKTQEKKYESRVLTTLLRKQKAIENLIGRIEMTNCRFRYDKDSPLKEKSDYDLSIENTDQGKWVKEKGINEYKPFEAERIAQLLNPYSWGEKEKKITSSRQDWGDYVRNLNRDEFENRIKSTIARYSEDLQKYTRWQSELTVDYAYSINEARNKIKELESALQESFNTPYSDRPVKEYKKINVLTEKEWEDYKEKNLK